MFSYDAFKTAAPTIATPIRDKLQAAGITFLATLRKDGSPRISPVEVVFLDGHLYFGSMPGAQKALDVARDPRCALITPLVDKKDLGGEGKLFAEAHQLDPVAAERVLRASAEDNEIDPESLLGSPCYEVLVKAAAWQHLVGEAWTTVSWKVGSAVRTRARGGATGMPEDI